MTFPMMHMLNLSEFAEREQEERIEERREEREERRAASKARCKQMHLMWLQVKRERQRQRQAEAGRAEVEGGCHAKKP